MRFRIRSKGLFYLSILFIISISLSLTWSSAKSWISYVYAGDPPPAGLNEAIKIESGNSQFYFLLAEYFNNYETSEPRSQIFKLHLKALELNPLNYNYWFYLADFLAVDGQRESAKFALNQATELAPGVISLRWTAGILASRLGDEKALSSNLGVVIKYDVHRRKKAFIILWQTLRNQDKILKIIPVNAYLEYLHFLIDTRRVNESGIVWKKLSENSEIPDDVFLRYVNFLIAENQLDNAKEIWIDRYGEWDGIWNGDFSKDVSNGGFDWRIDEVKGVKIERDSSVNNEHSIKIEFNGEENVDFFHLRQIVPVDENTEYRFRALIKSKDLNARDGLSWEVNCFNNEYLHAETDEVQGTTELHPLTLSFKTPKGCHAVVIRLGSYGNDQINRRVSGTAWIQKATLEKIF